MPCVRSKTVQTEREGGRVVGGNLGVISRSIQDGREAPGMVVRLAQVVPGVPVAGAAIASAATGIGASAPFPDSRIPCIAISRLVIRLQMPTVTNVDAVGILVRVVGPSVVVVLHARPAGVRAAKGAPRY